MEKPPKVGTIWNAKNLWDEFDYTHISLANTIHDSGQFLAWHRWYVRVLELAFQEECNYTGAFPYWDELKDQATAPLNESAVFDPVTGFGGDGDPNNHYCITYGPFSNVVLAMNASSNFAHDCISRQLNQTRFDQGKPY
ncbi:hypothetical protein N7493_000368 [Penicillium malachiteum]|uniref:Tyrosinase copper-binding domain-containing protein n=1 Tax=Penicillium malachiteum TaxID=1324776 RepID=A0AAD6HWS7_9EURO|nr:hypothetical protein N7493_000368 [Penicillium malachiteum]